MTPQIQWNISNTLSLTGRYGIDYWTSGYERFFPVNSSAGGQFGELLEFADLERLEDYNLFLNGKQKWASFLEADWILGINFNSRYNKALGVGENQFLNPFVGDLRALGNAEASNNFDPEFTGS
jgi:hypothetical protein